MKTPREQLADALDAYKKRFGEPYTFGYGNPISSDEEALKDIRRCLRLGVKKEFPDDDLIY